ncbi:hypothetical protein MLD38_008762 [Melastoma candidum]|uniref:Uncharacterized protein n=1 Tax=Melastoma candidum TaxID=119954 RepID=A0ACB9RWS2_9MYRT|nr:hypothetical protein MLD38_008762 [Melastoma candidum]
MGRIILAQIIVFLYSIIMYRSSSSRIISNPSPRSHPSYEGHEMITFLMRDVLNGNPVTPPPMTVQFPGDRLPFQKPTGLFPPTDGIPLPGSSPGTPVAGSTEPLDVSNPSFMFPAIATLQELELGLVTEIDEYLFRESMYGTEIAGKARGVYVASSDDGSSHMMAMTVHFSGDQNEDSLRFFGVHRKEALESHVAVIGGTGKYSDANGYATVKSPATYLVFTVRLS